MRQADDLILLWRTCLILFFEVQEMKKLADAANATSKKFSELTKEVMDDNSKLRSALEELCQSKSNEKSKP